MCKHCNIFKPAITPLSDKKRIADLEVEIANLRARIRQLEMKPDPYVPISPWPEPYIPPYYGPTVPTYPITPFYCSKDFFN